MEHIRPFTSPVLEHVFSLLGNISRHVLQSCDTNLKPVSARSISRAAGARVVSRTVLPYHHHYLTSSTFFYAELHVATLLTFVNSRLAGMQRPSWAKTSDVPVSDDEGDSSWPRVRSESPLGDITALESAIVERPVDMLEELRTLYAQRQRCGPIDPELTDLALAFSGIATFIGHEDIMTDKHDNAWFLLLGAGLGDFCEEVVGQEDFFCEHPVRRTLRLPSTSLGKLV